MTDETQKNMEDKILEAAEILFLEQGLNATTTGQIAKLAGCNQALIHYYYRTKEKLFEQVFEKKIRVTFSNLTLNFNTLGSFQDKICILVERHFDFLSQNPKLVTFLYNEIKTNPKIFQSLIGKIAVLPMETMQQIDKELKEEIKKGTVAEISGMELLQNVVSLNVGFILLLPMLKMVANFSDEQLDTLLKNRKEEIIRIILARLKP
jgi:AcrR family transcriptional regulator